MKKLDQLTVKNNIKTRIEKDIADGCVGGAAVLVKQNGNVIYKDFFGTDGQERELNDKTLFRLASMTKPGTGQSSVSLKKYSDLKSQPRTGYSSRRVVSPSSRKTPSM